MSIMKLWGQQERPYILEQPRTMAAADRSAMLAELAAIVGPQNLLYEKSQLIAYSYDATGERYWPDAVVIPGHRDEISEVLKVVARYDLPVIGRGAGTNLSGGTIPLLGGVIIAMARLNHPVAIDLESLRMVAEPGTVNEKAQEALARYGLFYPPDPASHRISTIGGNVSENSGGPHCVKYGVTTNHVVGIGGFLVDGTPLKLMRWDVPGDYDWAGLVCGSEGTLMVVTEAELVIRPLPEGTGTLLATYQTPEAALRTVSRLTAAHVDPSCLELLDQACIRLVEAFVHAGYPTDAGAVLLIEVEGDAATRQEAEDRIRELAAMDGALSLRAARTQEEATRLWLGRRSAYGALARQSAHVWVQDVTVPRPRLADMLSEVMAIAERNGVNMITVAHAGDGNLHPNISFNPADADEVARMRKADHEILEACVARQGSITGEHGVGIDKLENLALMYGPQELDMMINLKKIFDPTMRLNPYKAVPVPREVPPVVMRPAPSWTPVSEDQVVEAVHQAVSDGRPLQIVGHATRVKPDKGQLLRMTELTGIVEIDPDNLTAVVWAGTTARDLARELKPYNLEWAVDPWDPDETVGGMVAGAVPTFRRQGLGPVRDSVLGVTVVDGRGQVLRFGRPTIKNVAGYDVTKLLVGSWGTLGVLTRVILRLRPYRPLVWVRAPGQLPEQAALARGLLHRPDWPIALLGTRTGLVSAWYRRPSPEAGQEIEDPRATWGQQLVQAAGQDRWSWGGRKPGPWPGGASSPSPCFIWFGYGTIWGETVWVREHADVVRGMRNPETSVDPVIWRLSKDLQLLWDPHGIWRGEG